MVTRVGKRIAGVTVFRRPVGVPAHPG
jgi:hypothetical protein